MGKTSKTKKLKSLKKQLKKVELSNEKMATNIKKRIYAVEQMKK